MGVDSKRAAFFLQVEPPRTGDWEPPTDIYRTASGWMVKMELAGVLASDINLTIRGRALIVRGRRRDCCIEEGCSQLHMEIAYGRFERSIDLPSDLQKVALHTEFRDGMLHILIHREGGA